MFLNSASIIRKTGIAAIWTALALLPSAGHALDRLPSAGLPGDMQIDNAIAAVVEDQVITYQDVRNEAARLVEQVRRTSRNAAEFEQRMQALESEILQGKIDRVLIVKAFEEKGMQIPPSFIDSEINEILARDFDGDRSRLLAYLRENGMSMRDFRRETRKEIILRYMQSQMRQSEAVVSPVRIEEFYRENPDRFHRDESVHLRMIQLGGSGAGTLAAELMDALEDGADFAELAREHSRYRRQQGGSWGWDNMSNLREDWREIVASLAPGEHSEPIETGTGDIFILYVEDRREAGLAPLREVREEIEEILVNRMAREAQERWLERLRRDAYVRYY